jgi:hypothetical protein
MATLALPPSYRLFDRDSSAKRERKLAGAVSATPRRVPRLLCVRCRHPITDNDQRIDANGSHAHTCTNPNGITFNIGCFRDAPGCAAIGAATTEYTWFRGYAWRIADCAKCGAHLGWQFTSPADGFFGLIVDRLMAAGNH